MKIAEVNGVELFHIYGKWYLGWTEENLKLQVEIPAWVLTHIQDKQLQQLDKTLQQLEIEA